MKSYIPFGLPVFIIVFIFFSGCTEKQVQNNQTGKVLSPDIPLTIGLKSRHSAIDLAGKELARYLGLMAGIPNAATVVNDPLSPYYNDDNSELPVRIEIGLFEDFNIDPVDVEDPVLDDAVYIDINGSKGIIAGSNPRSVLFAVYRFLEGCGCRWIRPGHEGDYVPQKPVNDLTVKLSDRAKYRFRGNNNSGALSIDQIISKIEWGTKVGLNTYYNEFLMPKNFFLAWYNRDYPSKKSAEPRSNTEIIAYNKLLYNETERRGLLLHAAGHGWNGKFLGNPEIECDHWGTLTVPENQKEFLSLVGGERVSRGPTTTELCYGNPLVRKRLAQIVADFAQENPEVDYLHFWLDDRMNNTCECKLCRNKRVSDFFVMILNEIDQELTRRNISAKVVFLIYQDTLWPPEVEKLINQDRFVLMFAPISRLYDKPYEFPDDSLNLPPYKLNQNTSPPDIATNVGFLREWQQQFKGTGFVYDYHMFYMHYYDQGYYGYTDLLVEDIRRLADLKLDGFVSCQMQKTFYPHGFPHFVNARMLWNPGNGKDSLASYYFQGAFGRDGQLVMEYMKTLSELFSPEYFYKLRRIKTTPLDDEKGLDALKKISLVREEVKQFWPVIDRNLNIENPAHQKSWEYLSVHSGMVVRMADAFKAKLERKADEEKIAWNNLYDYIVENEDITEDVFDVFSFNRIFPDRR